MRVSIMDPGLFRQAGHNFDQALRIARGLRAAGHVVEVHAAAHVSAEIPDAFGALGASLHRTFRVDAYHRPAAADDSWSHWQQLKSVTCEDLSGLAPTDVAFWPSLTPNHFLAMVEVAQGERIVGALDGQINVTTPFGAELLASGRAAARRLAGRLDLGAYDARVADEYRPILDGLEIGRLPVPYDGHAAPPAERLGRVGFFGHQRGARGSNHIPEIAEGLLRRRLKVTIQDSSGQIAMKRPHPEITLLRFVDDFARELTACDLILWPSLPEHYVAKTSGVVWEAIASARPLVVPSGCLPARIAFHSGAATFFHLPTAASVLRAVDEAVANYATLARRAAERAQRWRAIEGTGRLVAALTAGRLPRWEPA
jgi:hypothetical protein